MPVTSVPSSSAKAAETAATNSPRFSITVGAGTAGAATGAVAGAEASFLEPIALLITLRMLQTTMRINGSIKYSQLSTNMVQHGKRD